MYENFKHLNPIDVSKARLKPRVFNTSAYQPNYYGGAAWATYIPPTVIAEEYTGWRDESLATHLTCAITTNLNPLLTVRVSGADAVEFLKFNMVNNFDKFQVGTTKHGIIVQENGNVAGSGVLMRTEEDVFELFGLSPIINMRYAQQKHQYDGLIFEDISDKQFVFQMMGPNSLEIIEEATQEDLHELKFNRIKYSEICGHRVRILRFGMHGGLGYEIHGPAETAQEIHKKIVEIGVPYGIRLLGFRAYALSHTPGASQQFSMHYEADLGGFDYLAMAGSRNDDVDIPVWKWTGSAGNSLEKRLRNPYELGLEKVIDYNHDFIGKEALLKYRENPKHTLVTLEWMEADIQEVYASQFNTEKEPYQQFDFPGQMNIRGGYFISSIDLVYNEDGEEIGISGGRTFSPFHGAMLSLASIELPYRALGTEVYVLWGDAGTRQKKIRAKVAPMPYNTHYSNKTFDVNSIPRLADKRK